MDDIFAYIEGHRQRFVQELCELLRQPSISTQDTGVTECAGLVQRFLRDAGAETQLVPTEGYPVVFGEARAREPAKTVLVYGHYDVQPPEPLDLWETPPFEPSIRNGRIYARGAGDNKGQMFAQIKALEAITRVRGAPPVNVKLCFEGEEEIGSRHFPAFVNGHRELLAADVAYSSDGPMHPTGPIVFFGCRGILYLELTVRGAKRDLHSGNYGGIAPAPAIRLTQAVAAFWTSRGKIAVEGFYDSVRKPTAADRKVLRAIPFDESAVTQDLGAPPLVTTAADYYERLLLQPNVNVAGLTAGYQGQGAKTVLPHVARAKIDVRLVMDQDPDEIEEKIRAHLKRRGFEDIDVRRLGGAVPPSRTPVDHPYGAAVIRAVERAWGRRPLVYTNLGGTIPDYLFTRVLGLPSIWVPYAPHDEGNHAPNESITVEGFINGIRSTAAALYELAAV